MSEDTSEIKLDAELQVKSSYKNDPENFIWEDLDSIISYDLRPLLGELLTIIESIGLESKQEKAVKDLIKKSYHQNTRKVIDRLCEIYPNIMNLLRLHNVLDPKEDVGFSVFGQRDRYIEPPMGESRA